MIDEITGEVIDENAIAEKKLFEVGAIDQETFEILEMFLYYQEQYDIIRYKLKKAMEQNGIKKWDNDFFTATYRDSTYQKKIDTDHLKRDGLYDLYTKLVPVKESVTIKFKDQRKL